MSDYERHKVTIRKLPISADLFMAAKLKECGSYDSEVIDDMDFADLYDCFQNEFYEEFVISKKHNTIYEITSHEELNSTEDILEYENKSDNTIEVFTQFYNGGTCLTEMLQEVIDKE